MFASEEEAMEAARGMHDVFESMLHAETFVPFRFSVRGSGWHEVQKPEHVRLRDYVVDLGYPDQSAKDGFQWRGTIALEHVVCLEELIPDQPTVADPAAR